VAKTLAPAMVALDKQNVLLTVYISRLKTWRATFENENEKTWRNLISRLVGIAVVIGALLLIGAAARSLTDRHVRDAERRHVMRVIERVVPWVIIVLVAALSFTSDLTSLATFFGLLTAGVAIALQSVILSALGYFLLVGKRGIRVGDRVQISGVTGNVTDIGWLQFRLQEIDHETQQPTGHVVTFSNSFVFVSPATGLSSHREDVKPAQLEGVGKTPQL
jgi:small-conductance mechanosensitive channel